MSDQKQEMNKKQKKTSQGLMSSKSILQRAAVNPEPPYNVPPIVHEVLNSPGQLLDAETRELIEPRFGYDFSQVRVHTDTKAAESAKAINASAYTLGKDIVFGTDQYVTQTQEGQELLAHELAHVVQIDGTGTAVDPNRISPANHLSEQQANTASYSHSMSVLNIAPVGIALKRKPTKTSSASEEKVQTFKVGAEEVDTDKLYDDLRKGKNSAIGKAEGYFRDYRLALLEAINSFQIFARGKISQLKKAPAGFDNIFKLATDIVAELLIKKIPIIGELEIVEKVIKGLTKEASDKAIKIITGEGRRNATVEKAQDAMDGFQREMQDSMASFFKDALEGVKSKIDEDNPDIEWLLVLSQRAEDKSKKSGDIHLIKALETLGLPIPGKVSIYTPLLQELLFQFSEMLATELLYEEHPEYKDPWSWIEEDERKRMLWPKVREQKREASIYLKTSAIKRKEPKAESIQIY
jgi:hypothetical protein